MTDHPVVGVDGCRGGWFAVVLHDDGRCDGHLISDLEQLDSLGEADVVAIDIPLGLPLKGRRKADVVARGLLGVRRSSIFDTPTRGALKEQTHADASAYSKAHSGFGLSIQSFNLFPRIIEAAAYMSGGDHPMYEVHPELSFTYLIGHPATFKKRTSAGQDERLEALLGAGIDVQEMVRQAPKHLADDMVDAAVTAWSARRIRQGSAVSHPSPPEVDDAGQPAAIWA